MAPRDAHFWDRFPAWFLALYRAPLAFVSLVLILPLLIMCGWLYLANEREWRAREGDDLLVAARLAARIIDEELTRTQAMQEAIASRPSLQHALVQDDPGPLTAALEDLLAMTPMADQVTLVDETGASVAQRPATDTPPPATPPGMAGVSPVYLRDTASGEKAMTVSTPVRDGEQALGAIHLAYRLEAITRWLEKVRVEPAGFLYIADQQGLLVAHPYQLLPGLPKDVSDWPPVAVRPTPEGRLVRFRDGRPARAWTAAVVLLEPYGWRIVAQQPDAAMLDPLRRLMGSFALLLALLAGVISLLALRWAHLHQATLALVAHQAQLLKGYAQPHAKPGPSHPELRDVE